MMKYKCKKCGEYSEPESWGIVKGEMVTARCGNCKLQGFGATESAAFSAVFEAETKSDPVEHPSHYTKHPSGVECITVTEHFNFNRGNAIQYVWRAGEKGIEIEDLKKARWYIDREIQRLEKMK